MAPHFTLKIGDNLKTPQQKRDYNEKVFAEIAPRYDFITRALSFRRDAHWKRDLVAALPAADNPFCVDLACGTGDITLLLAGKYPHGHIVGLDITAPMLDIARRRNTFPHVSFVLRDIGALEFLAQSVDIVTGSYALRNAPDLDIVIEEISRVLKPEGVAAFLDFSKPRSKALQSLEYWLLKIWGGLWGFLLHRNHEVYSYIAESLRYFPDRDRLRAMLRSKGFAVVVSRLYFFGIAELVVVRKKGRINGACEVEPSDSANATLRSKAFSLRNTWATPDNPRL